MQIILLEKVERLGNLGEIVNVKPGFARNYLLPQGKALRATKDAIAKFEAEKSAIEKLNSNKKSEAEKVAEKIDGKTIVIIRSASDSGQLYGSVTTRDIAISISELSGDNITRNNVILENPIKSIGYFDFKIKLHPEVIAKIKINVAQSEEEAELQAERVARGESAVITAAEEDAKIAAEIAKAQAGEMAEIAKKMQEEAESGEAE
ncbi:MAG: 50S ribosomal protein L9 [Alphaproteobacteria bacterium]|nr:50S ribosomal protein L9 [Alphaproteobacteria bacterium]